MTAPDDADTFGLVAGDRGVRIDTETGWSAVVAISPVECDRLAASFAAMAGRLRSRPDLIEKWDRMPELDPGDIDDGRLPEALIRADERAQLAEAGRLLPPDPDTRTECEINWTDVRASRPGADVIGKSYDWPADQFGWWLAREIDAEAHRHRVLVDGRKRTVRKLTDGSTLVGPWLPVPTIPDGTDA